MQTLRNFADRFVGFTGTLIVLVGVLLSVQSVVAAAIIIVGLLLMQAGIWHVASKAVPSGRKYTLLRAEIDRFIDVIRLMVEEARNGHWNAFSENQEWLHGHVPSIIEALQTDVEREHGNEK